MPRRLVAFTFYVLFFGILFLQFPLKDSIPGNCDSWLVISLSNQYLLFLRSLFDHSVGIAMFPSPLPFAYGESSPGCAGLFLSFKLFGMNDLWAYYSYTVLIFALTAFSVFNFTRLFSASSLGPLFAGFAFTCSNMMFAHIDDSIIYFWALPLTAAALLFRALNENRARLAVVAFVLGGLQMYFSIYVFIYQSLLLAIIIAYHLRRPECRATLRNTWWAIVLYLALPLPYVAFYLNTLVNLNVIDPFGRHYTAKMTSLMPFDFVAALPENPIYGNIINLPQNWGFVRHRNFIGLLLPALALFGCMRWNSRRALFIAIAVAGIVFAVGPNLMIHPQAKYQPPTILYPFYTWIPILSYLRVTNRAYFLVLLSLSVCAGLSIERITTSLFDRKRAAIACSVAVLVFLVHGIENIPVPFKAWNVAKWIDIPADYLSFARKTGTNEVFLDLPTSFTMHFQDDRSWRSADPSRLVNRRPGEPRLSITELSMFTHSWDDLFQYNREIIYMHWQTQHRRSSVNGLNGYFPTPRVVYQYWIQRLPSAEAIGRLEQYGVTTLIYHKGMEIPEDSLTLRQLETSPQLVEVFDGPTIAAFRFRQGTP